MIGQARTTGDETIAPNYFGDDGMFAARRLASGEIVRAKSAAIGDDDELRQQSTDSPGPGPAADRVPADLRAGAQLPAGAHHPARRRRIWSTSDAHLISDEKGWNNGTYASRLDLPVRVLPPETESPVGGLWRPPRSSARTQAGGVITGTRSATEGSGRATPVSWSANRCGTRNMRLEPDAAA